MQRGELVVTGTNHISISLRKFPSEVEVRFKDAGLEPIPCDPGDVDFIDFEVRDSNTIHGGFVLFIEWKVSSVREVEWRASY